MRIYMTSMFFILSKIVWILISPLTFIVVALLFGGFLRFFKRSKDLGNKVLKATIILFLCLSILPVGYNFQVFLEKQHTVPVLNGSDSYGGIIILGGCVNPSLSYKYNTPIINGSCERILEGIKLHHQFSSLPVIYTGVRQFI